MSNYTYWRADLIERIGNYCCYCNMPLTHSLEVEHVVPKNPRPGNPAGSLLDWSNVLLACGPCNLTKNNKPVPLDSYYLPEENNTHLAFGYQIITKGGKRDEKACVIVAGQNMQVNQIKAENTIKLLGLDSTKTDDRVTDLRWKFRYESYDSAYLWLSEWKAWGKNVSKDFLPLLKDAVKSKGFFSIWYSVFADEPEVKQELLRVFPGTDSYSFEDASPYNPKPRNPENLTDPL